jgi:S-adenosylmethionine:tRNA ribosyltransferase-isomerase
MTRDDSTKYALPAPSLFAADSYEYVLPKEQIAQNPVEPRDHSKLLVLQRGTEKCEHRHFFDLPDYLEAGDLLVLNNTRVLPARLLGEKVSSGAHVEILLLRPVCDDWTYWEALVRPGKKLREGHEVRLVDGTFLYVEKVQEEGIRLIRFPRNVNVRAVLDRAGEIPLPPYITDTSAERERYQTIYAEKEGSVAAPTAGLHFTRTLLETLHTKGIEIAFLTLHVGLGTFRPVSSSDIREHAMHREYYSVPPSTAEALKQVRHKGKRVIAVGTTVVRCLESASETTLSCGGDGDTDIFIYPGFRFRVINGMVTNFHLPRSTLLMLVAAFAGYEKTLNAYALAVAEKYRFFSFGDAMLVL